MSRTIRHLRTSIADGCLLDRTPTSANRTSLNRLAPTRQLRCLQRVRSRASSLIHGLSLSLQTIFSTLRRDICDCRSSLGRKLGGVRALNRRKRVVFDTLIGRLTRHVGRRTLSCLRSSRNGQPRLPITPKPQPRRLSPATRAR